MDILDFYVAGFPAPQGSKRILPAGGKRGGRPLLVDDHPGLKAWRARVTGAAKTALQDFGQPPAGAAVVTLTFFLPRPPTHFGTGKNAGLVKPSAPVDMAVKPDLDKLARAVFDSLTVAKVWADDSRVNGAHLFKRYADGQPAGVAVSVAWQGAGA